MIRRVLLLASPLLMSLAGCVAIERPRPHPIDFQFHLREPTLPTQVTDLALGLRGRVEIQEVPDPVENLIGAVGLQRLIPALKIPSYIGGGNRRGSADVPISAGTWTVGTASVETQSVTVAAGSDRLWVLSIGCEGNVVPNQCQPSATPTLGGTAATSGECDPAVTDFAESGGKRGMLHFYCWKDADIPSGCSTSCTLDINIAAADSRRVAYALWTGVDQTDSIGITCSNTSTSATQITCTLTGASSGNHNVANCHKNSNDSPAGTVTWASPFTERTEHNQSGAWGISSEADDTAGGASTADCTNAADGNTRIAVLAMELND